VKTEELLLFSATTSAFTASHSILLIVDNYQKTGSSLAFLGKVSSLFWKSIKFFKNFP
jgi:hypothetical protein